MKTKFIEAYRKVAGIVNRQHYITGLEATNIFADEGFVVGTGIPLPYMMRRAVLSRVVSCPDLESIYYRQCGIYYDVEKISPFEAKAKAKDYIDTELTRRRKLRIQSNN